MTKVKRSAEQNLLDKMERANVEHSMMLDREISTIITLNQGTLHSQVISTHFPSLILDTTKTTVP